MPLCQDWVTLVEMGDCGCSAAPNPTTVQNSISAASETLYILSGRQYPGLCDVEIRPCGDGCNCNFDDCGCNRLSRAFIGYDVASIGEVDVAGVVLDPEDYRLESPYIVRLDGGNWPCCQNMAGQPGDEDTFTVTALVGQAPSRIGIDAARALASELVRSCTPGEACALPERVTSITRQGVSMAILDPLDFLTDGRTGIYAVDLFLSTVNPNGLTRRSRAWSPDLPTAKRYPVVTS